MNKPRSSACATPLACTPRRPVSLEASQEFLSWLTPNRVSRRQCIHTRGLAEVHWGHGGDGGAALPL